MALSDGRERFERAVGILVDETGRIKNRLLVAYASQLSLINPNEDVSDELRNDFYGIRNALSDAEMPYGSGERAAQKLQAMSEDQASSLARAIYSIFLKLCQLDLAKSG